MNINPVKWDWSQWVATMMYLILIRMLFGVQILYPSGTDFIGGVLIGKIFTVFLPNICTLAVVLSAIAAQLYVYGFYVDVTLEYVMLRLAIPGGILGVYLFLFFVFSMPLKMSFSWKGAGIALIVFLLYGASIYLCYRRVEFRLVDMTDLEQLELDMQNQAKELEGNDIYNDDTRSTKRFRK